MNPQASDTGIPKSDGAAADGPDTALKRALPFPGVLMQSVGAMAPTATLVLTMQFITGFSGAAISFALIVAIAIFLLVAATLGDIAKRFPSAGGYYTYVRAGLGSRAGLFIALCLMIWSLAPSMNAVYLAKVVSTELAAHYSVSLAWPFMFVPMLLLVGWVAYKGVEFSGKMLVILGALELAILLALAAWGFAEPGRGGVSLKPFDPSSAGLSSIVFAVTFSLFLFSGWEGSAPVAEESENPRRNIPRAMVGSVALTGIVLVIATWGIVTGWGTDNIASFNSATSLPPLTLARHYWGGAGVILLIAILNSVIVIVLASTILVTRVLYAFARAGVAPAWFGQLHATHKTPANATVALIIASLVVGGLAGALIGPANAYFIYGLAYTLLMVMVYAAGNFAAVGYVRRIGERLNPVLHVLFPIITSLALVYVFYKTLHPMPTYPIAWGIWLALAWALAALAYALTVGRRAGEADIASLADDEPSKRDV